MDFRFIEQDKAKAIISCKSVLNPSTVEQDYCQDLNPFSNEVWLFAECCGPDSPEKIKVEAQKCGYKNYWQLYTWNRDTDEIIDSLEAWDNFVETVRSLRA
ncbi:hypothetical protein GXP67_19700 [Rhodocytophaga rosea]|uniref:Uncharacterized protein n=1 Tax=Rhodocytophaga rosea TaxID=2704465 RepID=A0A6C0GL53_9BACT|nr:hypothetical protein [Rhodocytophaga rosea]QHT68709.1 hypothetical protein GXP67_19700 [Rhodocytophaga rosea]